MLEILCEYVPSSAQPDVQFLCLAFLLGWDVPLDIDTVILADLAVKSWMMFLLKKKSNRGILFLLVIIQVDIPIKYLSFFLEDDAELEHTKRVRFLFLVD